MSDPGKTLNPYSITYLIDYDKPIELTQFTKALTGISSEYKRFLAAHYGGEHPTDAKLHIQKIVEGSIETTLIEYAIVTLPFLGDANTVLDFGKHLKEAFNWFTGRGKSKPKYDLAELVNLRDMLGPATAPGNSALINVNGHHNQVTNNIVVVNVNDTEANAAVNRINTAIKELSTLSDKVHTKQAFYWSQAKKDIQAQAGNYGTVDAICPSKLKVIFEDDSIKREMLHGTRNPFTMIYIVDVEVQTVHGIPKVLKILHLHEAVEPDDE